MVAGIKRVIVDRSVGNLDEGSCGGTRDRYANLARFLKVGVPCPSSAR